MAFHETFANFVIWESTVFSCICHCVRYSSTNCIILRQSHYIGIDRSIKDNSCILFFFFQFCSSHFFLHLRQYSPYFHTYLWFELKHTRVLNRFQSNGINKYERQIWYIILDLFFLHFKCLIYEGNPYKYIYKLYYRMTFFSPSVALNWVEYTNETTEMFISVYSITNIIYMLMSNIKL